MSVNYFRGAVDWALLVGLVFGAGAIAQAQQDEQEVDGLVVQIGQADEDAENLGRRGKLTDGAIVQQELPKYWIGLRGVVIGDDDPLRAHVDLPAHQGLLLHEIVPDSPAAKAGLKKYDILLRANDVELREMKELIELVTTQGESKGQISLDVLRHGERETVYLTPEERPADQMVAQEDAGQNPFGGGRDVQGDWQQLFQGGRQPFNFRDFGPGVIVGGGGGVEMPNGLSVSIQKEDGKPARVTVKRGGETWEVDGDNPESLAKLPADLRPFVEQMLRGDGQNGFGFQMPNFQEQNFPRWEGRGFNNERLQERLDQMERQMNELLKRFEGHDQPAEQPQAEQQDAE